MVIGDTTPVVLSSSKLGNAERPLPSSSDATARQNTNRGNTAEATTASKNLRSSTPPQGRLLDSIRSADQDSSQGRTSLNTADAKLFKTLSRPLQGLLALGVLSTSKSTIAQVLKSAPATPRQVQILIETIGSRALTQALGSKNHSGNVPQLLKLDIQGHHLVTLSKETFKQGQSLSVILSRQGQLTTQLNKAQPSNTGTGAAIKLSATPAQSNTIQSALRQSMPLQQPMNQVVNGLLQLLKLPNPVASKLVNASTHILLRQIASQIPELSTLGKSPNVKQLLSKSGLLQESHLAKLIGQSKTTGPSTTNAANTTLLGSVGKAGSSIDLGNLKTQLARLGLELGKALAESRGNKPSDTLRPLLSASSTTQPLAANLGSSSKITLDSALAQLPGQIFKPLKLTDKNSTAQLTQQIANLPPGQQQQLRQMVLQRLLQISQAGGAKIQAQQLLSLTEMPLQNTQRWCFDIPFMFQGQSHGLELEIQEREPRKQNNDKKTQAQSQWQIRLSLELPNMGKLQVDLKLVEQRSNIVFWFEEETALQAAKQLMQTLKQRLNKEGIEVEEIQCQKGIPPKLETTLQHNLINTKA